MASFFFLFFEVDANNEPDKIVPAAAVPVCCRKVLLCISENILVSFSKNQIYHFLLNSGLKSRHKFFVTEFLQIANVKKDRFLIYRFKPKRVSEKIRHPMFVNKYLRE